MIRQSLKLLWSSVIKSESGLIISIIFIFHVINNYILIVKQSLVSLPVSILESKNYAVSIEYFYMINEFIRGGPFPNLFLSHSYTPDGPLYFLTTIPFYFLFGYTKSVAILSNSLYLLILLVSVYGIGKKMLNKEAGLLACFLVSMIPAVFGYSQLYHTPFPLMALNALAIAFLLHTEYFVNRKHSFLFGVSAGLLGITKFTGAIYLIGPFVYFCYKALIRNETHSIRLRKIKGINLLLAIAICILILSLWYAPKASIFWQHYSKSHNIENSFNWKLNANFDYIRILTRAQLLPMFSVLFFISIALFLFSHVCDKGIILLWSLVPYVFFTLFWSSRASYFTIPCLPAAALAISFTIIKFIRNKKTKFILILWLVFLTTVQYLRLSYGKKNILLYDHHLNRLVQGKTLKDKYQELFRQVFPVVTSSGKANSKILVLSLSGSGGAMESLLTEANAKDRLRVMIKNPLGGIGGGGVRLDDLGIDEKYFLEQDFIIYTTENKDVYEQVYSNRPLEVRNDLIRLMGLFETYKTHFVLVKEIPIEGQHKLLVYKRRDSAIIPNNRE